MNDATDDELDSLIRGHPGMVAHTQIDGHSWAVTRTTRACKVISVDAEQLGTAEQFGANVWFTSDGAILRPCEVPEEKSDAVSARRSSRILCMSARASHVRLGWRAPSLACDQSQV